MEKYRQKQMESLHETYNRRTSTIRENYHFQVEQLRQSYSESADRFRDYRQQHLDSIRDNYSQQMNRLREFGSRRVEQIWEGYDRSISALRTFTLEQRMRILNQYKVKQMYVNKLLEAITVETNLEIIREKEAAIREVLGDEEAAWQLPLPPSSSIEKDLCLLKRGSASIQRSASYYSLPEFVIEVEEGTVTFEEEDSGWREAEEAQKPSTSSRTITTRITVPINSFLGTSQFLLTKNNDSS